MVEPFERLLECFRLPGSVHTEQVMRMSVDAGADECALEYDGSRFVIPGTEESLIAHTYSLLFDWIFGQVSEYFLLHGAAVARGGRGLVLCGQSGTGKSSLSCELAGLDGWEWLSDDVAPLSLEDGLLHPFPKSLSLRPGIAAPELLQRGSPLPVLEGRAKTILSPEAMGLRVATSPVRLKSIVFLVPEPVELHPETAELSVVIHRRVPGLLERVRELPDVRSVEERSGKRFFQLEISTYVPARCLSRVDEVCREAGALVIGTAREAQRAEPDFEAPPRLEAIQLDEAVRHFLRGLWGTAQYRLIAELGGGAALFSRVARILAGVGWYRLRPGRYDETVSLLRGLACPE